MEKKTEKANKKQAELTKTAKGVKKALDEEAATAKRLAVSIENAAERAAKAKEKMADRAIVAAEKELARVVAAERKASTEKARAAVKASQAKVAAAKKAELEIKKSLAAEASASQKAMAAVGRSSGMAGIQVQQFVGQIQGGQSAMVALSQQSADLGFVLGAPLMGAVVGITASVVGMALAFSGVDIELEKVSDTVPGLISKFNELDEAAKKMALGVVVAEIIAQEKALKNTKDALYEYSRELHLFSSTEETSAKTSEYTGTILKLELALKELKGTYKELSPDGSVLSAVMDGIEAQNLELEIQATTVAKLIVGNVNLANTYGMSALQVQLYKAELVGANGAQTEAIKLSFEMAEARREEVRVSRELYDIASQQTEGDPELLNASLLHEQRLSDEANFQEMMKEIKFTGLESVEELLFKEMEIHKALLDSKLINEEDFAKAQQAISKRYAKGKSGEVKQDKKDLDTKRKNEDNYMSAASSLAGAFFEDNKAIKAGIIIADTAVAINRQFADLPFPAAVASSVAVAASGVAQLAALKSASKGGGSISSGGGGSVSATSSQSSQEAFQPETTSLELSSADSGGSQAQTINFGTDSGDDLIDAIAAALNKAKIEGRA
jgi:hypothetical protein